MDVIYIRALTPTFSWGEPHNGGLSTTWPTNKTLSYALLRIILESCLSARLRASSRVHSQCTQPSSFITGSVQYGCDLWLHILGKQKSRSMKLYDRRIGFLFCGILTVCTARIFYRKVSHFTWRLNHKIFCFHTYYTCRYRKVNPIPCLQSSISYKFHRVKSVRSSYVNLHQQMRNGFVLYLPSWFW